MKISNPIDSIKSQLFTVEQHNLTSTSPDAKFEPPKTKALYKATGGAPIGEIGKNFNITQPEALFDAFIDCFGSIRSIDIDTLAYQETKGGSKIRFRVQVADFGFKNAAGKVDDLKTYATLTTGYDGLTKTSIALESFRLICTNGMRVLGTASNVAIKNVKGNAGKIESICNDMSKVLGNVDNLEEWFKYINGIDVKEVHVQKVIKESFGYNRADKEELSTARLATLDQIEKAIAHEISQSGGNLWGILNGVTQYVNHSEKWGGRTKADNVDYVYQAGGAAIQDRAQAAVRQLAKELA